MARIENAKGRREGSGYERVFESNKKLGHLMSRVQSAVISTGTELERIIKGQVSVINDLDAFLAQEIMPDGVFIADKQKMKKCETLDFAGSEPDFLIFKRRRRKQQCHVVELKDGDTFDTKKAAAEHRAMHDFISKNGQHLPYVVRAHFCCFNQNDRSAIIRGFKEKIAPQEAMTGREFCDLVELDYDSILELRKTMAEGNISYFIRELLKIPEVKEKIVKELNIG